MSLFSMKHILTVIFFLIIKYYNFSGEVNNRILATMAYKFRSRFQVIKNLIIVIIK